MLNAARIIALLIQTKVMSSRSDLMFIATDSYTQVFIYTNFGTIRFVNIYSWFILLCVPESTSDLVRRTNVSWSGLEITRSNCLVGNYVRDLTVLSCYIVSFSSFLEVMTDFSETTSVFSSSYFYPVNILFVVLLQSNFSSITILDIWYQSLDSQNIGYQWRVVHEIA